MPGPTRGRITSRSDWRSRRAEIRAEVQHYELGPKPAPPSALDARFADDTLSVSVEENGKTLSWTAPITVPKGKGPFPAVIGIGFTETGSLPADLFRDRGIATIQYTLSALAPLGFEDVQRGDGGFYKLYPDADAGSWPGPGA